MGIEDLKGKLVAVLGYGQEGRATTAYLIKHGIKPVLFDQKPWEQWEKPEQEKIKALGLNIIFGPGYLEELKGFDVAFRSPGIRLSDVVQAHGLPNKQGKAPHYTSQTKWFFDNCPAKIIGVTGTKGKGTTSALIYEMLKEHVVQARGLPHKPEQGKALHYGTRIYLTGNIGKEEQPLAMLDDLKPEDWVIYEASSFQLQDLNRSPRIAVVLMVTSEHLDYHKNRQEYLEAKTAITKFQNADDFAVINADFENSVKVGDFGQGKKLYFSRRKTEGVDCFIENGQVNLKAANFRFPISNFQLRGAHNLENVCAAMLAAHLAGVGDASIAKAAREFKGLEHRLEFVTEQQGIKFYNDSFSTTPETAIAAVKSFTEPLIIILGGSTKKANFTVLGQTITGTKNIKALILVGEEALNIKKSLGTGFKGKILEGAKNMEEIFGQIKLIACDGDVVLLSPACASFDMFKNYKDRGEQFKTQVEKF